MSIEGISFTNRIANCNIIRNPTQNLVKTIENPDLNPMIGSNEPASHPCTIKSANFDRETYRLTLEIEHEGPADASAVFYPCYWMNQRPSPKGVVFILVPQEEDSSSSDKKQIKATFDLTDPKYASFLNRFTTDDFKIRFIDSTDRFLDQTLAKPPGSHREPARYTTAAIGEEGQDGGIFPPRRGAEFTTAAIGEEGQDNSVQPGKSVATTLALGEEGQDSGISRPRRGADFTTAAIGEEGQDNSVQPGESVATTFAIGEEGQDSGSSYRRLHPIRRNPEDGMTTLALGEEGQDGPPSLISKAFDKVLDAAGHVIDRLIPEKSDPENQKISTCALGEEGQDSSLIPPFMSDAFEKASEAVHKVVEQLTDCLTTEKKGYTTLAIGEEGQDSSIQPNKGE